MSQSNNLMEQPELRTIERKVDKNCNSKQMIIIPKILLAEDSQVHQVLIEYLLRTDLGIGDRLDLSLAQNGRDAFNFLEQNLMQNIEQSDNKLFDLIILDYKMPFMDGLEVLTKTRELFKDKGYFLAIVGIANKTATAQQCTATVNWQY